MWPFHSPISTLRENRFPKFIVEAEVVLHEPLAMDGVQAAGYVQVFGVVAAEDELRAVVEAAVPDGQVSWPACSVQSTDLTDLPRAIRRRCTPVEFGIWYRSGRLFFTAGSDG